MLKNKVQKAFIKSWFYFNGYIRRNNADSTGKICAKELSETLIHCLWKRHRVQPNERRMKYGITIHTAKYLLTLMILLHLSQYYTRMWT